MALTPGRLPGRFTDLVPRQTKVSALSMKIAMTGGAPRCEDTEQLPIKAKAQHECDIDTGAQTGCDIDAGILTPKAHRECPLEPNSHGEAATPETLSPPERNTSAGDDSDADSDDSQDSDDSEASMPETLSPPEKASTAGFSMDADSDDSAVCFEESSVPPLPQPAVNLGQAKVGRIGGLAGLEGLQSPVAVPKLAGLEACRESWLCTAGEEHGGFAYNIYTPTAPEKPSVSSSQRHQQPASGRVLFQTTESQSSCLGQNSEDKVMKKGLTARLAQWEDRIQATSGAQTSRQVADRRRPLGGSLTARVSMPQKDFRSPRLSSSRLSGLSYRSPRRDEAVGAIVSNLLTRMDRIERQPREIEAMQPAWSQNDVTDFAEALVALQTRVSDMEMRGMGAKEEWQRELLAEAFNQAVTNTYWRHGMQNGGWLSSTIVKTARKLLPDTEAAKERRTSVKICVTVVSSVGGATTGAVAGGAVGATTGGAIGAAVGIIPAIFTFGLSIPFCSAVGAAAGLCCGSGIGGTAGGISGGVLGYKGIAAPVPQDSCRAITA